MSLKKLTHYAWRGLIFMHRWIGIGACLFFAMWFVTGLTMIYVGFPELTREERAAGLPRIDWNTVQIDPQLALKLSVMDDYPRELRLEMAGGEPVYRIQGRSFEGAPVRYVISAANGEFIQHVDEAAALATAQAFARAPQAQLDATIQRDQWTVAGSFNSHRPLYRIDARDAAGTHIYVSSHTGEVVLATTRSERGWNYLGAVTHWIYFTQLRANESAWRQVVLWISGAGIVVAVAGVWIGIVVMRLRKRYPTGSISPYRGWMKWHHIAGLVGGVFVITWVFSGWMSMDPPTPWTFAASSRIEQAEYAGHTLPTFELTAAAKQRLAALDARQAEFGWLHGKPRIWITDGEARTLLLNNEGEAIDVTRAEIEAAAAHLLPGYRIVSSEVLEREDLYWYSHHKALPLPVLRVKYDDPAQTWVHIDMRTGKIAGRLDAAGRGNRWLFSALHRLDFYWLLQYRPLWDVAMWLLSLAGIAVSVTGMVIGWRRLTRKSSGNRP